MFGEINADFDCLSAYKMIKYMQIKEVDNAYF